MPHLGAIVSSLYLEFLDGIRRRRNRGHGATSRSTIYFHVIVYSVQAIIVLTEVEAVFHEHWRSRSSSCNCGHTCCQLSQGSPVPPVQWQVIYGHRIYQLSNRRVCR